MKGIRVRPPAPEKTPGNHKLQPDELCRHLDQTTMNTNTRILKQSGPLAPANEPWTLIRDAIHDLGLQEKVKSVKIDMGYWHYPAPEGPWCYQCLAGATMSRRMKAPLGEAFDLPSSTSAWAWTRMVRAKRWVHALDCFRKGDVAVGLTHLGLTIPTGTIAGATMSERLSNPFAYYVPNYDNNPRKFKKVMLAMADDLEEAFK